MAVGTAVRVGIEYLPHTGHALGAAIRIARCISRGMDRAYVSRMVNLTTLAPDIVEAILDETLPAEGTLFDLASATPLIWDEQRALLESLCLPQHPGWK